MSQSVALSSADYESESSLTEFDTIINDVFSAYRLSSIGLSNGEISRLLDNIKQVKKTFPYLLEAINSNRHPRTIMIIGAKIGMYIPPRKRVGIDAYNFFLNNIKYYEATFERINQQVPTLYEIYMSKDRVGLLMKFKDDEIMKPGYKFSRNYSSREEMINNFIKNNILPYGEFKLESNSRRVYSGKAKVIVYNEPGVGTLKYTAAELLKLFDYGKGIVWKDQQGPILLQSQYIFSKLSLLQLRQLILEKLEQWRHRDGYGQYNGPNELVTILNSLERILSNEVRNDAGAYLGNPVL